MKKIIDKIFNKLGYIPKPKEIPVNACYGQERLVLIKIEKRISKKEILEMNGNISMAMYSLKREMREELFIELEKFTEIRHVAMHDYNQLELILRVVDLGKEK